MYFACLAVLTRYYGIETKACIFLYCAQTLMLLDEYVHHMLCIPLHNSYITRKVAVKSHRSFLALHDSFTPAQKGSKKHSDYFFFVKCFLTAFCFGY